LCEVDIMEMNEGRARLGKSFREKRRGQEAKANVRLPTGATRFQVTYLSLFIYMLKTFKMKDTIRNVFGEDSP